MLTLIWKRRRFLGDAPPVEVAHAGSLCKYRGVFEVNLRKVIKELDENED